ncbi:MAG TPA: metallopeptidase family protein [Phycisphaerales bacterium]|nr:metallopeptidase family protein [Phycisphaerales bacterium]
MTDAERARFDRLVQDVIDGLPGRVRALLERVPLVVLDRPTPAMMADLERDGSVEPGADPAELCGLHTGLALTERSVEHSGVVPDQVHVFREGIVALALREAGWASPHADEDVYEEIRVTILHELGHHFGLDEDDLDDLGYA